MVTMVDEELNEIYAFTVQLAKDAGKMLMDAATLRFGDAGTGEQSFTEKDNAVDLVTKTDLGAYDLSLTISPLNSRYAGVIPEYVLGTDSTYVPRYLSTNSTLDVEHFIHDRISKTFPNFRYDARQIEK